MAKKQTSRGIVDAAALAASQLDELGCRFALVGGLAAAERIAYRRGTKLPVARVGHLITLEILSESDERLQDRIDLKILAGVATDEDWSIAEVAVRLIRSRRYHRARALVRRLRRWREATRR